MEKSKQELLEEIDMLRLELRTAREAAEITSDFVVKQFEQTERMLYRFQTANSQRQAVLDAATQLSIIATDLDGTIRLFSKGAATLLGYKPSEMIERCNILSLHLPEELEYYGRQVSKIPVSGLQDMKVFDQFVKQKQSRAQEWIYLCKDGSRLPVSLSITSLYNPVGGAAGYLFTAMDLTLQKQMARELIAAKEIAESANASKSDFLARMSHEIRTPMNGIVGMAALLQKTAMDAKQYDYVDKLIGSANSLLRLINDILDFSKIDAGKLELESVDFNLEDILGNIANIVGIQAEEKGVEFLYRIDQKTPRRLNGDPLRLGQILMNLTGNAVKFTERGRVVVSVDLERQRDNEVELLFGVRDTGIGLVRDQVDHLFSAFSQADDSITRRYGGTGLGLAICKQLTELLGGRIWVESTPGKGTHFFFTAQLRLSDAVTAAEPPIIVKDDQPVDLSTARGSRILLVDDNVINQEVAAEFLRTADMVVTVVSNGWECLEALLHATYDLILMDIQMPGMDGLEATRRIRRNRRLKELPIIAMTAHAMSGDRDKSLAAGMNDHLTKPIDQAKLFRALKKWLPQPQPGRTMDVPRKTEHAVPPDRLDLPRLPGIDQEQALKTLDYNTALFLKMLHNFKTCYGSLPDQLRELAAAGDWREIQRLAHSVKGVAGYIGSSELLETALELENALRNDERELAAQHLDAFTETVDGVLSTLSLLPATETGSTNPSSADTATITHGAVDKEATEALRALIGQLKRGEASAEEQCEKVREYLSGTAFEAQLHKVANLIDEIEYERAAESARILLETIIKSNED